MRRYHSFIADSARWDGFAFRDDDIVISTPSKCGTTWMQNIVGMLVFGETTPLAQMSTISLWLDMLLRPRDDVIAELDAQEHRRFIKTHTALDGVPWDDRVTYLCVVRHPLDAALSNRDHGNNVERDLTIQLRADAVGLDDLTDQTFEEPPEDAAGWLRWWLRDEGEPGGAGMQNLEDYANSVRTYWDARERPNVHLFHYADLWSDLDREMRRVAAALGIDIATTIGDRWPEFVESATLDSMRSRAVDLAPNADIEIWKSTSDFFRQGGRRDWASMLTAAEVADVERRLVELVGDDAAAWALRSPAG